jgi:hypothetical protein
MKRVNIFCRIDRFDDFPLGNLFRQRQLHQDAVNLVVLVQPLNDGQ